MAAAPLNSEDEVGATIVEYTVEGTQAGLADTVRSMPRFFRPDPQDALRQYLDLLEKRPDLVGDRSSLQIVTSVEELWAHMEQTGDALGVVLSSPFGLVLVDLVESEGHRFPYIRFVSPQSSSTESGVVAVALTEADELVMVETLRHATSQVHLELPRGYVAADEDPVAAGLRELQEETGFRADAGHVLGSSFTDTGLAASRVAFVLIRGIVPGASSPEREEAIERVRLIPLTDVGKMLQRQEISDGFTLQAIGLLSGDGQPWN